MDKWSLVAAVAVPVATFLFALYQWIVKSAEKREREEEARWEKHHQDEAARWAQHIEQEEKQFLQHEKRWDEQAQTIMRLAERIAANEHNLAGTRDELHRDYVREDSLKEFRDEVRTYLSDMRSDVGQVFQKLSGVSRDLNQAIGKLNARQEDRSS